MSEDEVNLSEEERDGIKLLMRTNIELLYIIIEELLASSDEGEILRRAIERWQT